MAYKTILVYLNHEPRARRLLEIGVDLARHFNAHLIGLHVFPAYGLVPLMSLPFDVTVEQQIQEAIATKEAGIKAIFDEMTSGQPFVAEWRSVTNERREAALTVIDHAVSVDLVIAGQTDPNWSLADLLDFPERIALAAGRPVVVVPNQGQFRGVPRRMTIAWNNRRESARAVSDALPLLQAAESVHVLSIAESEWAQDTASSMTGLEQSLIRHRVNVQCSRGVATEFTVGEEIRLRAIDLETDLLVMGCYGHSQAREYAFGGVTRHLLRDMTIPIMISH